MVDLMPVSVTSDLLRTIFATIDRIAYTILDVIYRVFFNVATEELFSNDTIRTIYFRCQMVIGIFMLFKFATTILEGIVDPTRITDKKQGAGKIITRIITSLIILALITPINIPNPANEWEKQLKTNGIIFGALYSLQDRVLKNNTLGKLILGTLDNSEDKNTSISESASQFTKSILKGFLRYNIKDGLTEKDLNKKLEYEDTMANRVCETDKEIMEVYENGSTQAILSMVNETCEGQSGEPWGKVKALAGRIFGTDKYVLAYSPLGGISALILSVILLGFTVDIAVRAIKLAVLRLIAPIPIISHMNISAKEGKGADSFSLWVKALTTTYIDLFVRLAVVYFATALVHDMIANGIRVQLGGGITGAIGFVFIVIGLYLFARQAPKFLSDVLGLQGTMSNIGLSAILSGAGAVRAGGTFEDVRDAVAASTDNNINAINSGKAAPGLGMAYNAGRDLAAQMITGNEKMTYRNMMRGRRRLAHEGITPAIANDYKSDMYQQKDILQAMEDAQNAGPDKNSGMYTVSYKSNDGHGNTIYKTKQIHKDKWAEAIAQQRERTTQAESQYNDMKAEQQKYGQTVSYREKTKGSKQPYRSARSQKRTRTTMTDNWHDNTAAEFNTDNGVSPPMGDQL